MKNLILLFSLFIFLFSCEKEESTYIEVPADSTEQEIYYLSFLVTCYDNGEINTVNCKVSVFDKATGTRLLRQSTNLNGWILSVATFAEDAVLRIELWDGTEECLAALDPISVMENSSWFIKSKDDFRTNMDDSGIGHYHFGTCGEHHEVNNPWGP